MLIFYVDHCLATAICKHAKTYNVAASIASIQIVFEGLMIFSFQSDIHGLSRSDDNFIVIGKLLIGIVLPLLIRYIHLVDRVHTVSETSHFHISDKEVEAPAPACPAVIFLSKTDISFVRRVDLKFIIFDSSGILYIDLSHAFSIGIIGCEPAHLGSFPKLTFAANDDIWSDLISVHLLRLCRVILIKKTSFPRVKLCLLKLLFLHNVNPLHITLCRTAVYFKAIRLNRAKGSEYETGKAFVSSDVIN